jgi:hypothetical protein
MIVDFFERMVTAPVREVLESTTFVEDEARGNSKKAEVRRICAELPTLEKFADSIGVTTEHLDNWAKANPDFYDARARAKQKQFIMLTDGMLSKRYDTTAAIFVAKNITWMREKIDNRFVDEFGKDRSFSITDVDGLFQIEAPKQPE